MSEMDHASLVSAWLAGPTSYKVVPRRLTESLLIAVNLLRSATGSNPVLFDITVSARSNAWQETAVRQMTSRAISLLIRR